MFLAPEELQEGAADFVQARHRQVTLKAGSGGTARRPRRLGDEAV
jgi:hypothetical protein